MLRIAKRTFPLVKEGEINRLRSELDQATGSGDAAPFTASRTYKAGEIIINGGKAFVASAVIISGETIVPGGNCIETNLENIINALQEVE